MPLMLCLILGPGPSRKKKLCRKYLFLSLSVAQRNRSGYCNYNCCAGGQTDMEGGTEKKRGATWPVTWNYVNEIKCNYNILHMTEALCIQRMGASCWASTTTTNMRRLSFVSQSKVWNHFYFSGRGTNQAESHRFLFGIPPHFVSELSG